MWHAYALLAQDIIRERQREASDVALARVGAAEGVTRGGWSMGRARMALAAVLRRVAAAAGWLAAAARGMAARLEGRVDSRVEGRVESRVA